MIHQFMAVDSENEDQPLAFWFPTFGQRHQVVSTLKNVG